jgi:tetratricopeptide (TPR) repeat protein
LHSLLEAYQASGDTPGAVRTLQALAGLHPSDAGLRYRLGLMLAAQEPESALAHLAQAAEMDEAYRAPAQNLIASIQTASLGDDPAFTLVGAGRALASLGEWKLAELAFHQAVRLRPDYAEAWAFWGEARQQLDPLDPQAAAALEKALELDNRSLTATMLLSLYWQRQDRSDRALEILQEAAPRFPTQPALQVELGNLYALQGDLETGLQAHQRAVELAPNDQAYLRLLAEYAIRHELRPREVALPAARRAIALNPQDAASLDVMGQALLLLNDLAGAERFFLRAVQQENTYAPAHLHLGLVFVLQDLPARAYAEWKLVSRLAPGSSADEQAVRLINNYFP